MFPKTISGFYWSVIRKFPLFFIGNFILILGIYFIDNVTFPFTAKWSLEIFQGFADGVIIQKLYWIIGIYVGILVVGPVRRWMRTHWEPIISRYTKHILLRRVYENDVGFFVNQPAGQTLTQIQVISNNLLSLTLDFYANLTKYSFGVVIVAGAALGIDWRVGVMLIVAAIGRVVWMLAWQRPINRVTEKRQRIRSKINGLMTDSLGNAITVKMFSNATHETNYVYDKTWEFIQESYTLAFWQRVRDIPFRFWWFSWLIIIMVFCGFCIRDGVMTVADAVFAVAATRSVSGAFNNFLEEWIDYVQDRSAVRQAWKDIIRPIEIQNGPRAKKLKANSGMIEFDDVSFDYGGNRVISHLNLGIKKNEKIGIVGLSGAGKTTLVNLLVRAYDVKSGTIRIGGMDVRDIMLDSLRRSIALVPQDLVLFNRSLMDNIRYARPSARRRDVIDAARRAHIHDFIMTLPDGYDTLVGNRGIKLSGGQRQRIAIARAILKDAPIFILDEATSALDSKSEVMVQSALKRVMRGRTTIAIAHRLSTLRDMDRIIVLSNGKIIESGSHAQLLRRGGVYRKLWDMQTGGYIA